MQDTDDGGGLITGTVILDGVSNMVFDDISGLDRVNGDVSLRKVFPAVWTLDTNRYYGAHISVDEPFADPLVDGLLFDTNSWSDERANAANQVESYVIAGPTSPYYVWGRHVTGQRSLLLWGRVGVAPPDVGEVYYVVENEGDPEEYFQYVRLVSVEVETRTFTDNFGDFQRDIITCEISAPLRYTFNGPEVTRSTPVALTCKVRETDVADSTMYYGITNLSAVGAPGDTTIQLASVYAQLVPSARTESPVADVYVGADVTQPFTSGGEEFGIVGPVHTGSIDITLANRSYVYVYSCVPIPAAETMTVSYRALNKWYTLRDVGNGVLEGQGGGAGSINFLTGTVSVTLGALPDVGSAVVFTWGGVVHYVDRAGTTLKTAPRVMHSLGEPVAPGSASFSWTAGGVGATATAAANGDISGDATGHLCHATGEFWLDFTTIPTAGGQIQVDYDADVEKLEIFTDLVAAGGVVNFTLTNVPAKAGSVRCSWQVQDLVEASSSSQVIDITPAFGHRIVETVSEASVQLRKYYLSTTDDGATSFAAGGSINYTTGACTLSVTPSLVANSYDSRLGEWSSGGSHSVEFASGTVTVKYIENTGTPTTKQVFVDIPDVTIQFLPLLGDRLVPGTLRFTLGGTNFTDGAGLGVVYWDDNTIAGSVNYETRTVTLSTHTGGSTIAVTSLVSVYGDWIGYAYSFRTPGSPVQPGSLVISAVAHDGTLLTAAADANGDITGDLAEGYIEQDMGVAYVRFGESVLDSSLTPEEKAEPWYDAGDVDEFGYIWKPTQVYPATVRFSVVVYTYLPLDAEVLGLDPVRLPSDGRVPIFRPGNVVVVHHEDSLSVPTPSLGLEVDCGRTRLARVRIYDADGDRLLEDTDYTVDLDTGIITLGDPAGWTAPYTVLHRVEDMALAADVQIDGAVRLTQQLTHDFPADETYVSSSMILGDLYARVAGLFEQETWTGEWSDTIIGDAPLSSYDDVNYPIAVTNTGAITERWALIFTGSTSFIVVGENVGNIGSGNTVSDLAPVNPNTSVPYFELAALGWGAGWSTGNVVRFNTVGANHPVWCARSVQQGSTAAGTDSMVIYIRGDIDTEV